MQNSLMSCYNLYLFKFKNINKFYLKINYMELTLHNDDEVRVDAVIFEFV